MCVNRLVMLSCIGMYYCSAYDKKLILTGHDV